MQIYDIEETTNITLYHSILPNMNSLSNALTVYMLYLNYTYFLN